ncbi:MAG TPA: hypothetical protein DDX33_00900 [Rikenellaceae bacterium]|nr:hypothetical protein [Rikenellaceae bacterium]
MKKILYIFAIASLGLACSKSDRPVGAGYPADGIVRISPSVGVPITKAREGTEFNGSRLGLGLYYGEDDRYNKTSLWKRGADGRWNSSSALLWKNAEDEVVVYAFVPDGNSFSYGYISVSEGIPSDQSAGLERADWLWYSEKIRPKEALNTDGELDVVMNHALLKLTVNLEFGNELGDTPPEIKEVWLNGTMRKVYVSYMYDNKGQLIIPSLQSPMDIKMHKVSANCYEAIFYPSTGQMKGGDMLTVILSDGRDYRLKLSEDLKFEKDPRDEAYYLGGCAYSMSVRVGKDKTKMELVHVGTDDLQGWVKID